MPKPARKLSLHRETLTELTTDDLRDIVGAAPTLKEICNGGTITVFLNGCPTDPRSCHYYTDFC